jgi:uncharacterized protein
MRIVIDINHPAQVHFFKHFIWEMEKRGHKIIVTASNKDLTKFLINKYDINSIFLNGYGDSIIKKIINVPIIDIQMYKALKRYKPDLFIGFGSIRVAHVATLFKKPCINFDDDEYSYPFYCAWVDTICGFSGFKITGTKIIKILGFKEMAYLHPNHFRPNPAILEEAGISSTEKFSIVRFVSWKAFHDIGKTGFDTESKKMLIHELEKHSRVFISSEGPLLPEFEKYRISISPEKIHDFLSFASILVSDSQTMTTEAAVLGTPAVRCNSFVGKNDMNNFIELENKYNLIYNCQSIDTVIRVAVDILNKPNLKNEWGNKREILLHDKIDVTSFMIWFVDNYPNCISILEMNPEKQNEYLMSSSQNHSIIHELKSENKPMLPGDS